MLGTAFHMLSDNSPLLNVPGRLCIIARPTATGSDNTKIFISDDSVMWTTFDAPASVSSRNGKLMAYDKVFYFFPNDGATNVCTSVDGATWDVTAGPPLTNIYGAANGYVWGNTATIVKSIYKIVSGVWTLIATWPYTYDYTIATDGSATSPYMIALNPLTPYDANRSFGATSWLQLSTFQNKGAYGLSPTATDHWRTLMGASGPYLISVGVDNAGGPNVWTTYAYRGNTITTATLPGTYKSSGGVTVGNTVIGYDRVIICNGDFVSSNGTTWFATGNATAVSPFIYANGVFLSGKHISTDGITWTSTAGWQSTLAPYVTGFALIARG